MASPTRWCGSLTRVVTSKFAMSGSPSTSASASASCAGAVRRRSSVSSYSYVAISSARRLFRGGGVGASLRAAAPPEHRAAGTEGQPHHQLRLNNVTPSPNRYLNPVLVLPRTGFRYLSLRGPDRPHKQGPRRARHGHNIANSRTTTRPQQHDPHRSRPFGWGFGASQAFPPPYPSSRRSLVDLLAREAAADAGAHTSARRCNSESSTAHTSRVGGGAQSGLAAMTASGSTQAASGETRSPLRGVGSGHHRGTLHHPATGAAAKAGHAETRGSPDPR